MFDEAFADLGHALRRDKTAGSDDLLPALVTFHNGKLGDSPSLTDRFFGTPEVQTALKEEGLAFHNAFPTRIALAPAPEAPEGSLGARMSNGIALRQAWQDEHLTSGPA